MSLPASASLLTVLTRKVNSSIIGRSSLNTCAGVEFILSSFGKVFGTTCCELAQSPIIFSCMCW